MDVYETEVVARSKSDESPVTHADEGAEAILLSALAAAAPGVPVIAEEEAAAGRIPAVGERFFLVDPLDGTKEFLARNGEFTVNVARVDAGAPAIGVVFAPALGRMFAPRTAEPGSSRWTSARPVRSRRISARRARWPRALRPAGSARYGAGPTTNGAPTSIARPMASTTPRSSDRRSSSA